MIAFDLETHLIQPNDPTPKIVCMSWSGARGKAEVVKDWVPLLRGWLESGESLCAWNLDFEWHVVRANAPELTELLYEAVEQGRLVCAMRQYQLAYLQEEGHLPHRRTLAHAAKDLLDIDLAKGEDTWRLRYAELDDVPLGEWPEEAIEYSKNDAIVTWQLADTLANIFMDDLGPMSKRRLGISRCSVEGIMTDRSRVQEIIDHFQETVEQHQATLLEQGFLRLDAKKGAIHRNDKITKEKLKKLIPMDQMKLTDKGNIRIRQTIEAMPNPPEEFQTYVEYQRAQARIPIAEALLTSPVRSRYDMAETGRVTSSGPNLQNIPRDNFWRRAFVPREGCVFVVSDYSSMEMRTWAQAIYSMLGYCTYKTIFEQGLDAHSYIGSKIAHVDYQEFKPKENPEHAKIRQFVKILHFGGLGGSGHDTMLLLSKGVGLSESKWYDYPKAGCVKVPARHRPKLIHEHQWMGQYRELWNDKVYVGKDDYLWTEVDTIGWLFHEWFTVAPDVLDFFDIMKSEEYPRTMTTPVTKRSVAGRGFTQACNFIFQAPAADAIGEALFRLQKECDLGSLKGCRPVLNVHDEVVLEAPAVMAEHAKIFLERIMIEAARDVALPDIPVSVDAFIAEEYRK